MIAYIISFYRQGERRPADGYGPFATREDARSYAAQECARVAAIAPQDRDPTLDWAHRFTVQRIPWGA